MVQRAYRGLDERGSPIGELSLLTFRIGAFVLMKRTVTLFLGATVAALCVAACSGGSGVTPSPEGRVAGAISLQQRVDSSPDAQKSGTARIVVTIPSPQLAQTEGRIHTRYVSPNTESMVVESWSGVKKTFNLWPGTPGCPKAQSSDARTCTKKISLPSGQQKLTVTLYDAPKAKGLGAALSSVITTVKIVAGKATTLSLATDGIPTTATVLLGNPGASSVTVTQGEPTSAPVSVNAYDAKGNLIVPPGNYATPILLIDNDASGATTLSKTTIKAPDTSVTLNYNGSKAFGGAMITPSIGDVTYGAGAATISGVTPAITEYTVGDLGPPGGWPASITAGPDGAMWFTRVDTASVGRITTTGSVTEFSEPPASEQSIVTGPDGAFWYTTSGPSSTNDLVRLTTGGAITEYSVPIGVGSSLAFGPDGALWTTDNQGGMIAKITTTGTVTTTPLQVPSPIPSSSSSPTYYFTNNPGSITSGSDGALWFSGTIEQWDESCYCNPTTTMTYLDRMTTTGVVTAQYPVTGGSEFATVGSLIRGSDGALWFIFGSAVGRMTTNGTVTTYQPTGLAEDITSGPDGALWFSEDEGPYMVGRITTAGAITEFSLAGLSTSHSTRRIASGPDNAVWFTDSHSFAVVRVPVAIAASDVSRRKPARRR